MLESLVELVDIRNATATVHDDLTREMGTIERTLGFDAVNSLARGAIRGSYKAMKDHPEVLAAACGAPCALTALDDKKEGTLCAAAAGGFSSVVQSPSGRNG